MLLRGRAQADKRQQATQAKNSARNSNSQKQCDVYSTGVQRSLGNAWFWLLLVVAAFLLPSSSLLLLLMLLLLFVAVAVLDEGVIEVAVVAAAVFDVQPDAICLLGLGIAG